MSEIQFPPPVPVCPEDATEIAETFRLTAGYGPEMSRDQLLRCIIDSGISPLGASELERLSEDDLGEMFLTIVADPRYRELHPPRLTLNPYRQPQPWDGLGLGPTSDDV